MSNEYVHFNNNSQPAINEDNLNLMQQLIKQDINGAVSGDTLPLGAMIPFPGGTIPDNYLLCDGSAVSRTTYALLFNVIGTTYGSGDGSTTFNLPDMRLRTAVGVDARDSDLNAVGKTYGEKNHTLTKNELPANIIDTANTGSNTDGYIARAGYTKTGSYNFGGAGQPFNVMQPSMATNYIIKAFQTAGVVAQVANTSSNSQTDTYSCDYINTNYLSVTELYKDNTGSTGSVTLSETANNFKYIEIIYGADGYKYSTKVRPGDSFATGVQSVFSSSSAIALYASNWTISGTSITFGKASNKYLNDSNSVSSYGTNPYVRIYEVLGYK